MFWANAFDPIWFPRQVAWIEPTGPAFGRPDDRLREIQGELRAALPGFRCAQPGLQRRQEFAKPGTDMNAQARSSKLIKGRTGDWEVVVGMEVHAQVTSFSKLFSGAATEFGGEPNSHVSLVDAAMPGMLPVINEECIKQAIRSGLGLKARINGKSVFDRKNYFYPDLPQGYQISQYKSPIVGAGEVVLDMADGETVTVGIERLHLEQDAGKLLHDRHPGMSSVDLNRSGVALMEIVSKPDLRSAEEAKAYVAKLRTILRYLGTCDGDMEKGNLRADVNVSVRKPGAALGTRCEVKNVNSFRFMGQAIEFEARRQIAILEDGGKIEQETRLFDPLKCETRSMRNKEEAHDYRYFPDPDLVPLELDDAYIEDLRAHLPELPDEKRARFARDYGLGASDAALLVAERATAEYFEAVARGRDAKTAANWVSNELTGRLNKEGKDIASSPVSAEQLGSMLDLIAAGTISGKIAKDLFDITWNEGGDPAQIVRTRAMTQMTDLSAIEKLVDDIVRGNPDKVKQAKAKPAMFGWFVGQVMKASGGKANPQAVNELLRAKLQKTDDGGQTTEDGGAS
jgi:aspartyl-tRNA(Asn)/glutamyl-tRNA(Gln) amidotransferase subunit B